MKAYAIYDRVAEEYSPPFLVSNDGLARRQFRAFIERNQFISSEFWLSAIGDFDPKSGVFTSKIENIPIVAPEE